jgi:hypothetical protein
VCLHIYQSIKQTNRCIIIAPNIDEGSLDGGLDDTVKEIIELGRAREDCQVLFALNKKKLGKALGKSAKQSAIGVSFT